MSKFLMPLLLLIMFMLGGCAMDSSFGDMQKNRDEQLGYMLYEEALEFYGKPDSVVRNGDRLTAEWVRSGVVVTERLKLTFDERQIMRSFDYHQIPFE